MTGLVFYLPFLLVFNDKDEIFVITQHLNPSDLQYSLRQVILSASHGEQHKNVLNSEHYSTNIVLV